MDSETLEKIVFAIGAWLIGWGTWITRRMFTVMTRVEHEAVCEKRNAAMASTLSKIEEQMKEDRVESREYREHVQDQMHNLATQVAVLVERSSKK